MTKPGLVRFLLGLVFGVSCVYDRIFIGVQGIVKDYPYAKCTFSHFGFIALNMFFSFFDPVTLTLDLLNLYSLA